MKRVMLSGCPTTQRKNILVVKAQEGGLPVSPCRANRWVVEIQKRIAIQRQGVIELAFRGRVGQSRE